jgi:hypothetical protein
LSWVVDKFKAPRVVFPNCRGLERLMGGGGSVGLAVGGGDRGIQWTLKSWNGELVRDLL